MWCGKSCGLRGGVSKQVTTLNFVDENIDPHPLFLLSHVTHSRFIRAERVEGSVVGDIVVVPICSIGYTIKKTWIFF